MAEKNFLTVFLLKFIHGSPMFESPRRKRLELATLCIHIDRASQELWQLYVQLYHVHSQALSLNQKEYLSNKEIVDVSLEVISIVER